MLGSLLVWSCLWGQTGSLDATRYVPLYREQAEHPWDALHRSFFVRSFTTAQPHDLRYKFVLDRAGILAGQPGLVALDEASPLDAFGFESTGQWAIMPQSDADGETLVLGRHKTHGGVPSLGHCVACHGPRNHRFHANFGSFPAFPATNAALDLALETGPPKSASYRKYLDLRTTK